jgi:hypothetical protein
MTLTSDATAEAGAEGVPVALKKRISKIERSGAVSGQSVRGTSKLVLLWGQVVDML